MKPEKTKITSRAKGEARVKTLIRAHLYWLSGFPYKVEGHVYWCCPSLAEVGKQKLVVTSKMISKAHRVINELRRDYPVALPRVVGDAAVWERRCKDYLDFTKAIHSGPKSICIDSLIMMENTLAEKLRKKFGNGSLTCELGIANSWMHYVDRGNLNKSFEFVYRVQNWYSNGKDYSIVTLSKLCLIYLLEGKKTFGYIQLFLGRGSVFTSTNHCRAYINPFISYSCKPTKKNYFNFSTRPKENTSASILDSLDWMLAISSSQRKRALALLDAIDLAELLDSYCMWWHGVDQQVAKISNLIKYPDINKIPALTVLQNTLKIYLDSCPENFDMSYFFSVVNKISQNPKLHKALCQFFTQYASLDESVLKSWFLIYFDECLECSDVGSNYFTEYINALSEYLRQSGNTNALSPWEKLSTNYWSSCESDIFIYLKSSQLSEFFNVLNLTRLRISEDVSKEWIEGVVTIIAAGYKEEKAAELSIAFIGNGQIKSLSKTPLKIAFEQNYCVEKAKKLLDIWCRLDEEYTDDDTLELIYKTFKSIEALELFNDLIFSKDIRLIRYYSNQIRVIKIVDAASELPIVDKISEEPADWISLFPREYHANLSKLNYMCSVAERKARKIILKYWWPEFLLEQELKKLSEQLPNNEGVRKSNIERRIQNFKARLESHTPPTKILSDKIQHELAECVKREQFECWLADLDKLFKRCWGAFLEIEYSELPQWLIEEKMIRYLLPVTDFKISSRKLAKYVIKHRIESDDWLFKEHPKNQSFLKQLSRDKFNTQVWCDGIGEMAYYAKSSKRITINAVQEPLEILNMGGHFKTCLSPGSFNYFSVFSNIVDINKRVIYGKTSDGKVVGRVLIGLMPSGGIKVFNIYVHHDDDEFESNVLKYIETWVNKAGFTLTDCGDVPKLVSTDWYDDGAINVDNTIECLKEGASFRKQLLTIASDVLEKNLTCELKPLPINELTLPLVIGLPEIVERPDLMPTLIKLAQSIPRMGEHDIINLFYKAHDTLHGEQCYRVFRHQLLGSLLRSVRRENWFDPELAYRVAHYSPSDALRMVKRLGRSRWKGDWRDNLYAGTARVAVKSLNMLGRHQQAKSIARQYKIGDSI